MSAQVLDQMRDLFVALIAGLAWAAILKILDEMGWAPEARAVGLIMKKPSAKSQRIAFWSLVAVLSFATLLLVNRFIPNESSPTGITINGNHGIITKGQAGDNNIK